MNAWLTAVQPVPEVALDRLRQVAEVEVYPDTDRQVSVDELVAAARRSDYLFTLYKTITIRRSPGSCAGWKMSSDSVEILGHRTLRRCERVVLHSRSLRSCSMATILFRFD